MRERVWISKVQNLILDGSMVSTNFIKALCGLMPDLKVLSMKSTLGSYEDEDTYNEHFMHATGYSIHWDDGHEPEDDEDWLDDDEDEGSEEEGMMVAPKRKKKTRTTTMTTTISLLLVPIHRTCPTFPQS